MKYGVLRTTTKNRYKIYEIAELAAIFHKLYTQFWKRRQFFSLNLKIAIRLQEFFRDIAPYAYPLISAKEQYLYLGDR